ncbi:MAG: hypothetical protein WC522_00110 [Candidatus Omnitrophota bacterium]
MRLKKRLLLSIPVCLAIVLAIGLVMNMQVSIRQGINGRVREIKMPLYIKAMEFLARDYEYHRITREIIKSCNTDEEKALAIFDWTHENIKPTPPGMPIVDDHILNIIIRGYGAVDQSQDVFTNLCAYAGLPAFFMRVYTPDRRAYYPLSFVKIKGRWRVFDSYNKKYFRTNSGEIAGVEDLASDRSIIDKDDIAGRLYGGVPYKEFYYNLKPWADEAKTMRSEKQMPLKRFIFEMKKSFGIEKEEIVTDESGQS